MRTLFVALTVFFASHVSWAAEPLPAEIYGADADMSGISLSPDGTKFAYLSHVDGVRHLVLIDMASRSQARMPIEDVKARRVGWASDDHLMLSVSDTKITPALRAYQAEMFATFCAGS